MCTVCGLAIVFPLPFDYRLPLSFFFSWLYLRLLMKSELTQKYGDTSREFALSQFFPESRLTEKIDLVSDKCWDVVNYKDVIVNALKKVFKKRQVAVVKKEEESTLPNTNEITRKKALKNLDNEISSLMQKELQKFKEESPKKTEDVSVKL